MRWSLAILLAASLAVAGCGAQTPASPAGLVQSAADPSSPPLDPPVALDASDRAAVVERIAAALHQDPDQLGAQLQSDPSATLMTLAKPLGIAQDRLAEIVLAALSDVTDGRGASGSWTQNEVVAEKQFWAAQTQGALVAEVSRWFETNR
ncbi:MAG: hypothetical protein ACHQ15_05470 [Candidatus Limnocylindrales bacterium]